MALIHHILKVEQGACTGVRWGVGKHDHDRELREDLRVHSVGQKGGEGIRSAERVSVCGLLLLLC